MIVRLKDQRKNVYALTKNMSFNSMIVRLKVRAAQDTDAFLKSFNSMIVRLKGQRPSLSIRRNKTFQFYDSPIKSACYRAGGSPVVWFQFYDSPIKS